MNLLRQQFLAHVAQTSASPFGVEVARAEGIYFYDPAGKRYTDLIAGVSVSNVGHANPTVVKAVQDQAADYMHVMVYGELVERPQIKYATWLTEQLPAPLGSVYFVNSGTEAIEGAIKLARRATGRTEICSMRCAYHGSTMGAMSIMGGEEWRAPFRPLLPNVRLLNFNSFDDIAEVTERTACVVVEPVQGEAGVRLPAESYLQALRERCTEMGALLIFDEIQTGAGRTGAMFACQKYDVVPDVICLAKALGGGMPLGAFVASREVMSTLSHNPALGHITTFGGHPVCCAAGLAAAEYILAENLLNGVETKGKLFESMLCEHTAVHKIRRTGLLMAVELGSAERMYRMMSLFIEAGILSDWFLFCDTAFRISPPLTITEEQVSETCITIMQCLDRL